MPVWYPEGDGPDRAGLLEWGIRTRIKWWLLHPSCIKCIRGVPGNNDVLSSRLFRAIQNMLLVRTNMGQPLILPDGKQTFPRSEMPACEIKYVQC